MMVRLTEPLSFIAGIGLAVFSAISLWPGSAEATMYTVNATLNEAQAISTCNPNPPPANGGGSAAVMYDDSTNMLSWNISFSNLSGAAVAAHFHGPATPGMDAGIQVTIGGLTSPSIGSAAITETQEAQLLGGLWYINYHTSACAGGEIRGQVVFPGVGGVTELSDPAIAPFKAAGGSDSHGGLIAGLAAGVAALTLAGAAGAMLAARRLLR